MKRMPALLLTSQGQPTLAYYDTLMNKAGITGEWQGYIVVLGWFARCGREHVVFLDPQTIVKAAVRSSRSKRKFLMESTMLNHYWVPLTLQKWH